VEGQGSKNIVVIFAMSSGTHKAMVVSHSWIRTWAAYQLAAMSQALAPGTGLRGE